MFSGKVGSSFVDQTERGKILTVSAFSLFAKRLVKLTPDDGHQINYQLDLIAFKCSFTQINSCQDLHVGT